MTETMRAVSHSNRGDPRNVFSEMFRRGVSTPTDGGRASGETEREEREDRETEMQDVDHEAPDDADVSRVWKRGGEDVEE
jgi:hypothetical protein